MTTYIIRRLLYTIPIVFGVLLLTFVLFTLVGGDISIEIAGKNATPETIKEIREEYGLNKPLFLSWDSQFINHFKSALTFDFGRARDREPVIDKIKRGAGPSLALMVPMFLGEVIISISIALIIAFVRGSKWDILAVVICVAGMSVPYLSFILFGQYFLAYKWGLFPVFFSPDLIIPQYVVLPVLIGIITGLGGNVRFYRTVMLDEMRSDYVRTAFAKGLRHRAGFIQARAQKCDDTDYYTGGSGDTVFVFGLSSAGEVLWHSGTGVPDDRGDWLTRLFYYKCDDLH